MIDIQVENLDEIKEGLKTFGDNAPKMLLTIVRLVANNYKKDILKNYLSGQYLTPRTGVLRSELLAFRNKKIGEAAYTIGNRVRNSQGTFVHLANIYESDSDIFIVAKNKKAIRFIGKDGEVVFRRFSMLKPRPFMTDSANTFPFDSNIDSVANTVIYKQVNKDIKNFEARG